MNTDISVDTKKPTLQGVVFPLHADAQAALEQYRSKRLNYVQLVSFTLAASPHTLEAGGLWSHDEISATDKG